MRKYILTLFILVLSPQVFSCGSAYIFKMFPMGMLGDTIVSIDVRISRMDNPDLVDMDHNFVSFSWNLRSYITKYNDRQEVLSSTFTESIDIIADEYDKALNSLVEKGYKKIVAENNSIDLFSPQAISFCGYQKECNLIAIDSNLLIYKDEKYPIHIVEYKNNDYFGFAGGYFPIFDDDRDKYLKSEDGITLYNNLINGFAISSTRRYLTSSKEVVITHLQRGHELGMEWFAHSEDDFQQRRDRDQLCFLSVEYTPDFDFCNIRRTTYAEPLMHHGYGFDVIIMKNR